MIVRKSQQEIEGMARAGELVAETIALLGEQVQPGVTTDELDRLDVVAAYGRRGLAGRANPNATGFNGQPVVAPGALEGGWGRSYGTIRDNEFPDASVGLDREAQEPAHPRRLDKGLARENPAQLLFDRASRQSDWAVAFLYHGNNARTIIKCTRYPPA